MKGHLYFIGIAGHAMRGVALACREKGYRVTGLDPTAEEGVATKWLSDNKLHWTRQFKPEYLDGVTTVIVTGAHVHDKFPAIVEARKRGLPIKSSAELVGEMTRHSRVISVAGTHGKTTTTSLITWLLESDGRHPDFLIGIRPFNFESSVRLSGADLAVIEGDEYRASLLETKSKLEYYHPDVLVLTSVEHDHPDLFPDLDAVKDRFRNIIESTPNTGHLIVSAQNAGAMEVAGSCLCQLSTYGLDDGDFQARDIAYLPTGIEMDVMRGGVVLGRFAAPLYGRHNVENALAAIAVVLGEGMKFDDIIRGAVGFKGSYRRTNILTPPDARVTVIDDYAHHTTEAKAMIGMAKLHFPGRRIVAVYRPHTYSRTEALLPYFKDAFSRADLVYMTDIEGARETGQAHHVSGKEVAGTLSVPHYFEPDRQRLAMAIARDAKPGDVVLCMTVSGFDNLADELAKSLNP